MQNGKKLIKLYFQLYLLEVPLDKNDLALSNNNYYLLRKYFLYEEKKDITNIDKLSDYFAKFKNFCFDLDVKNMLNGSFNFIYR